MDYHKLHKDLEAEYPNIVGVGFGYKIRDGVKTTIPARIIYVKKKLPLESLAFGQLLPSAIEGVQTDVIEMGTVRAYENTGKYRPVIGGVSVGHKAITAGTVAARVYDVDTRDPLLLSNNHVLAMSNDAEIGDEIYQPGPADGGTSEDTVARLERFVPIKFMTPDIPDIPGCDIAGYYAKFGNFMASLLGSSYRVKAYQEEDPMPEPNYVDAAVAYPLVSGSLSGEIKDIGMVRGTKELALNLPVHKSGRTTELTMGEVQALNLSVSVSYGGLKAAYFVNQAVVVSTVSGQAFSAPGDSGSLVLDRENNAVGLLFAGGTGNDQAATIINPINFVTEALNITFN